MAERELSPDGFETKISEDGEEIVLTLIRDNGDRWAVHLSAAAAGIIGESLLRESGKSPHDASFAKTLRPDQTVQLAGQFVRPRSDGGALLELLIETAEGQGIAVPVELPPRDLAALMEALNKHR